MSDALRLALSDHDPITPCTSAELRTLAREMEDALIASEAQFSDPDWRIVDGLRALALKLDHDAQWYELGVAHGLEIASHQSESGR